MMGLLNRSLPRPGHRLIDVSMGRAPSARVARPGTGELGRMLVPDNGLASASAHAAPSAWCSTGSTQRLL